MKRLISSPENPGEIKKKTYWVFLAGPCQGAPEWQQEFFEKFPDIPGVSVTFLNPRVPDLSDGPKYYKDQLGWETKYLAISDAIVFWFPPMARAIPGREYGQTTRVELGEWIFRAPEKLIVGIHPDIPGRRYFKEKLRTPEFYDSMEDVIEALRRRIERVSLSPKTYFTSDTHFGSQRTLELSRRPWESVEEMDRELISRWNNTVSPVDRVYHLGDFGNPEILGYLNGEISLVPGNYEERLDNLDSYTSREVRVLPIGTEMMIKGGIRVGLAHRPSDSKDLPVDLKLFGHTHGRQICKPWPGIDVGVDGNLYVPMSEDDILFLYGGIKDHYDEENWL